MHSFTPKFDGIAQERQTVGALCVSCVVANAVNLISFYLAIVYLNCRQCIRKMLIKRCANYKFVAPIFDAWCSQLACPLKWIQAEWKKKISKATIVESQSKTLALQSGNPHIQRRESKTSEFGTMTRLSNFCLSVDQWQMTHTWVSMRLKTTSFFLIKISIFRFE